MREVARFRGCSPPPAHRCRAVGVRWVREFLVCGSLGRVHVGGGCPRKQLSRKKVGPSIDMGIPVWNFDPAGGTSRRGARYTGDPARGKDGLLWETALTWRGRNKKCVVHGKRAEASMEGRPSEGGLTCMVRCGTVSAVQDCGALLAKRLAIGEPRGAGGAGEVSCGGVVSLRGAGLVSFSPSGHGPC